jgi:ribonuclease P/MRP protein subunit RPP1
MNCADAGVHPYPEGDSSLRRLAEEAAGLGYDCIVCTGQIHPVVETNIPVICGAVVAGKTFQDVLARIRRSTGHANLIMACAGDAKLNRALLSYRGIHILRGVHTVHSKAFDHICAKNAAESGTAINISLFPIVHGRGGGRQKALRCYSDVLRLHRRYGFPVTVSSDAHSILDLRSARAVPHLCSLFGMEREETEEALGTPGKLLHPRRSVEVVL